MSFVDTGRVVLVNRGALTILGIPLWFKTTNCTLSLQNGILTIWDTDKNVHNSPLQVDLNFPNSFQLTDVSTKQSNYGIYLSKQSPKSLSPNFLFRRQQTSDLVDYEFYFKTEQEKQIWRDRIDGIINPKQTGVGNVTRDLEKRNQEITFAILSQTILLLKRTCFQRKKRIENCAAIIIQAFYKGVRERRKFLKTINCIKIIQRAYRTRMKIKKIQTYKILLRKQEYRTRVVMEIYATEVSYIRQLEILVKYFIKPLRALDKKIGISQDQINSLFSNVEEILEKHRDFLKEFKAFNECWSIQTQISTLFHNMVKQIFNQVLLVEYIFGVLQQFRRS